MLEQLLALRVDRGHALAEHRGDLVAGHGPALVDQARDQGPALGLTDRAQIRDVGHPGLTGQMRDLRGRDPGQPHLGRAQRVQAPQMHQVLLELGQRRRLRRRLEPVELAAPQGRVHPHQPGQPITIIAVEAGGHRRVEREVGLGADRRDHLVQRGEPGQLTTGPHQLLKRHVDQIGGIVLGDYRLADGGLRHLAGPPGQVDHPQPVAHELPVSPQRPLRLVRGHHPGAEPESVPEVVHHRRGRVGQLREVAQALVGLQQHHQRQQVRLTLRAAPGPRDLVRRRGERLGQLRRRNHPLEPRVCGATDRSHPAPRDATRTNDGRDRP